MAANESPLPTIAPPPRKTADEVWAELKQIPLFMTDLADADENNEQLQALRALAYEGTRAEIADNFRNQGNDCVRTKQWKDAREFYTKALQALHGPKQGSEQPPDIHVVEMDEEAEAKKERIIEEAVHANRALVHLEMKNYGSCQRDCASALRLNPRNVKAWYRAASACLALDKISEAVDACSRGLAVEPDNGALRALQAKVERRQKHLAEMERQRQAREDEAARNQATIRLALNRRKIHVRQTDKPPDMEDAAVALADPTDANSSLSFPVVLLYPMHAQSDFIKAMAEDDTLAHHLKYILSPPWDNKAEYTPSNVDCYMETVSGGLVKVGKNVKLGDVLSGGKVEVVDSLVKISVVPRAQAATWIEDFKRRRVAA